MLESIVLWLDQTASSVFWTCAAGLVLLDVAAVGTVLITRSRALVDRWTGRVLAANLLLFGAGLGVPAAAYTVKLVASAFRPALTAAAAEPAAKGELPRVPEAAPFAPAQK